MKLTALFADFLKDTVNLNQDRIAKLEGNVDALKDFVRQCEWKPKIRWFEEQGSWAHQTIIRPVDGDEFDADLLVLVNSVDGWTAADYVTTLGKAFAESSTYADKVKTWDYCVTVTYKGDRKVDIAPCVVGRKIPEKLEVCNRKRNLFEASEPIQYTKWLKERNSYSGSNSFRKTTRLIKYIRDIKNTFTCPSVLLTTLLGQQIEWWDKDSDDFLDTPTTLRTVMRRLDDWLQARPNKPRVENPKLATEDFASGWTDTQYSNFRNFIKKYRKWIDEAYEMEGRTESIEAWRKIFGDNFAKGEIIASDKKKAAEDIPYARAALMSSVATVEDWVEKIRNFGLTALPAAFNRQPHMMEPPWTRAANVSAKIHVFATWHEFNYREQGLPIQSGELLPPRGGLWFDIRINQVELLPAGYRVQWRITNTGPIAFSRRAKRGIFYSPTSGTKRWEDLEFRGVHITEAFIIRTKDELLVGQSQPFNVVIE